MPYCNGIPAQSYPPRSGIILSEDFSDLSALTHRYHNKLVKETENKSKRFHLQVLTSCNESAAEAVQGRVVSAMGALSHHSWTPVIQGTAAAIAVQTAQAVSANVLISKVPTFLVTSCMTHCIGAHDHQTIPPPRTCQKYLQMPRLPYFSCISCAHKAFGQPCL